MISNNTNKNVAHYFKENNASYEFKQERKYIFLSFFIFFIIKRRKKESIKRLYNRFLNIYEDQENDNKSLQINFEIYYNKYIFWPSFKWFSFVISAILSLVVVCLIAGIILSQPLAGN